MATLFTKITLIVHIHRVNRSPCMLEVGPTRAFERHMKMAIHVLYAGGKMELAFFKRLLRRLGNPCNACHLRGVRFGSGRTFAR